MFYPSHTNGTYVHSFVLTSPPHPLNHDGLQGCIYVYLDRRAFTQPATVFARTLPHYSTTHAPAQPRCDSVDS